MGRDKLLQVSNVLLRASNSRKLCAHWLLRTFGHTSLSSHTVQQTPSMITQIGIILPLTIAVCVGCFGLMKIRMKDFIAVEDRVKFQDVRLRVSQDMVDEYATEWLFIESGIQTEKDAMEHLSKTLNGLNNDMLKAELQVCTDSKKNVTDSMQKELKIIEDANAKEKADWEAEIAILNEKLNQQSPICDYLKAGSSLPGICPEKKAEEAKQDAPKAEEAKQDAQKPEEAKKEEAKQEEAKKEEDKPEEAKKEEAKPEEAKQEAPKQEEAKQ